jgi:hypothetical protein
MNPAYRAAMLDVTSGVNKRFDSLSDERKDIVSYEMLAVRRTNRIYKWMIDNCHARTRERGPKALRRACQQILSLRDTSVMTAVQRKMPSDILSATRSFFEYAEEMLEACGRLDDDAEDHYNPNESEMEAQAQYDEVKRLRDVLAKVGVRGNALVGKMVGFTSGREISAGAVKKRFTNKKRKK